MFSVTVYSVGVFSNHPGANSPWMNILGQVTSVGNNITITKTGIRFLFFLKMCSRNCLTEGEVVFEQSWVSQLCFAKWTVSIRGQRGACCRVLLKGNRRKTNRRQPPCFLLFFFQPHCPATEGQWYVATMYGSAACRVAAIKSKQSPWWREGRMRSQFGDWHEGPPGMVGDWVPFPLLCFN